MSIKQEIHVFIDSLPESTLAQVFPALRHLVENAIRTTGGLATGGAGAEARKVQTIFGWNPPPKPFAGRMHQGGGSSSYGGSGSGDGGMECWAIEYSEGPVFVRETQRRYHGEVFQIIERWQATADKGSIIYEERLSGPGHDSARVVTFYTSSVGSSPDSSPMAPEVGQENQVTGSSAADSFASERPRAPAIPHVGTGDTTVLCADDPRAQAGVKFILGAHYEELAEILPLATYVEPNKPVRALGGVLRRTTGTDPTEIVWFDPGPCPDRTILVSPQQLQICPDREVFLFESHHSFFETISFAGPFLVFSRVIILPDPASDELGIRVRQSYPGLAAAGRSLWTRLVEFYKGTIAAGSGPWVDFLELEDGTAWGADRTKKRAALLARLDGLDNAAALETLKGIVTMPGTSSSELMLACDLAGFCRRNQERKSEMPPLTDARLTVLRADDPAATAGVKSVLGSHYDELVDVLPTGTFVDSSKPVRAAAGTLFSIRGFSQTFLFEPGPFPAGPMIVFPSAGAVFPGQASGQRGVGMKGSYRGNLLEANDLHVPRSLSGPWVDFLEFDDGTSWGNDALGCRNRAKERAAILEKLEGLDNAQAQEVLKGVMAKPNVSWPEQQLATRLAMAISHGDLAAEIVRIKKQWQEPANA